MFLKHSNIIFSFTLSGCGLTFAAYLAKKRAEGKHYNVAISHAVKKISSSDLSS